MSLKHLSPIAVTALSQKRGILFMADWRPPELPGYLMSVVGCIDTDVLQVSLFPEDYEGEVGTIEIPGTEIPDLTGLVLESHEAMAVHRLWNEWHNGRRAECESLASAIAFLIDEEKIRSFLDTLQSDKSETQPVAEKPAARASRQKRKGKRS